MSNTAYKHDDKMRHLVKDNNALILVMGRFGISLGFGDMTVHDVCHMHGVDEATFLDFNLPTLRRKLIEAIDCSGGNDIAMLIVRFYDEYVAEVRKHMEHENEVVFAYVEQLLQGFLSRDYSIKDFAGKHTPMSDKLKELKDIIIRYCPEKNNYLLNAVLLDILLCEQDLTSHCMIEDHLFVPAVKLVEQQLALSGTILYTDDTDTDPADSDRSDLLSDREKDILISITKGLSNKEIADTLCLSVHTVATHRRNISQKLQIHSTAGLIIYAIANKLVDIADIQQ